MQSVSRLYNQFHPRHYDVHWDLTQTHTDRTVRGHVTINGEQLDPEAIRLHVHSLDIASVQIDGATVTDFTIDDTLNELVISHHSHGLVTIDIDFSLSVSDAMHGIYPCYFVHDGVKQELYATQFESHHAREGFPCIDEPEAKATYSISLTHAPHLLALSNMPIKSTEKRDKAVLTKFDITPIMSSYLVAFVVGDLQRASHKTKSGVEVNIYATKVHSRASLDFALDHASRTIEFFNEYFGVPYPLPKSDHVALPDFSAGAMENWGLVTYREIALLADPKTTSTATRQYVAEVIAHELSHQWFGNLVTMKWWDNLWLNESFATVMGYLAPAELHPEWNNWFEFTTSEAIQALRRDCIDGVQPVQVAVNHPDEISTIFDGAIVYAKGGRLLHMMQTWIGEYAFRRGLKQYFTDFQYRNTVGDDLWNALSEASGKDVKGLMNTWITQSGYPVVHAALDGDELVLRQEQFFVGPHKPSDKLWPIPLRANLPELAELFDERELRIPFTNDAMLLLNSDDTGHYIVNYDDALRQRILASLSAGKLSDIQRAQLLNAQLMLARGGVISSASLIELLPLYGDEQNEKVWETMALTIADLKKFVETDKQAETNLRSFVANLARSQYERLGTRPIDGESENDIKLRPTIIGSMLYGEDPAVIEAMRHDYDTHSLDELDPELRSLAISSAVRYSDDASIIDTLVAAYRSSTSADLKHDITAGLTATRDGSSIDHLIDLLKDGDTIRKQDIVSWFVSLMRNRHARDKAWQWLRDEWAWVEQTFDGDKSYDYFPRYVAMLLVTREQLSEYHDFFLPHRDNPSLTRVIDMGLLDLEGKIDLIERDSKSVAETLARYVNKES